MAHVKSRADSADRASAQVFESDLPETAKNLVRLLGWEGAFALIREHGGVPFPVPKAANSNRQGAARYERLAEIVGKEGADRIVAEYGDDDLMVPNCKSSFARAKNRAMVKFYSDGATLAETARAFGCTTRWVSIAAKRELEGLGKSFRMDL